MRGLFKDLLSMVPGTRESDQRARSERTADSLLGEAKFKGDLARQAARHGDFTEARRSYNEARRLSDAASAVSDRNPLEAQKQRRQDDAKRLKDELRRDLLKDL